MSGRPDVFMHLQCATQKLAPEACHQIRVAGWLKTMTKHLLSAYRSATGGALPNHQIDRIADHHQLHSTASRRSFERLRQLESRRLQHHIVSLRSQGGIRQEHGVLVYIAQVVCS